MALRLTERGELVKATTRGALQSSGCTFYTGAAIERVYTVFSFGVSYPLQVHYERESQITFARVSTWCTNGTALN